MAAAVDVVAAVEYHPEHESIADVDSDEAIVHSIDSDADEVYLVWSV